MYVVTKFFTGNSQPIVNPSIHPNSRKPSIRKDSSSTEAGSSNCSRLVVKFAKFLSSILALSVITPSVNGLNARSACFSGLNNQTPSMELVQDCSLTMASIGASFDSFGAVTPEDVSGFLKQYPLEVLKSLALELDLNLNRDIALMDEDERTFLLIKLSDFLRLGIKSPIFEQVEKYSSDYLNSKDRETTVVGVFYSNRTNVRETPFHSHVYPNYLNHPESPIAFFSGSSETTCESTGFIGHSASLTNFIKDPSEEDSNQALVHSVGRISHGAAIQPPCNEFVMSDAKLFHQSPEEGARRQLFLVIESHIPDIIKVFNEEND